MAIDIMDLLYREEPEPHKKNEEAQIADAIKYGVRAYLGQQALWRASDSVGNFLFPDPMKKAQLAEETLRTRMLGRQMGLSDEEIDEMINGPSIASRMMSGTAKALLRHAITAK